MIQAADESRVLERKWIVAAQAGDAESIEKLCELHHRFVWKCARAAVRPNHLEICDLFQVGMLALVCSIKQFDIRQDVRLLSYAGLAIKRSIFAHCGRSAQRPFQPLSRLLVRKPIQSREMEVIELRDEVRHILSIVPRLEREVLQLRGRGLTFVEIAEQLGISRNFAGITFQRAVARIRYGQKKRKAR